MALNKETITAEEAWDRLVVQQRTDGWASYLAGALWFRGDGLYYECSEGCCEMYWANREDWLQFNDEDDWVPLEWISE